MKKFFLLPAFCLAFYGARAQGVIDDGSVLMGGNAAFSYNSTTTTQSNLTGRGSDYQFSFIPMMGYFFKPNFCAGMSIGLSSNGSSTAWKLKPGYKDTFTPYTTHENLLLLSTNPFAR